MYPGPSRSKIFVGDIFTVDADAFVNSLKMRRRVKSGAQAGGAQNGFEHRRGRTFSVSSGDVHARDVQMRIAESGRDDRDIFQAEFLNAGALCGTEGRLSRRRELFTQRKQGTNRFVVRHR